MRFPLARTTITNPNPLDPLLRLSLALSSALGEILIQLRLLGLSSQLHLLLLGHRVEVGGQDEPDKREERFPHDGGEVVLRYGNGDGTGGPGDPHDGPESGLDGLLDIVDSARSVDVRHAAEVDGVGKDGNGQVGRDDLQDLVARRGSARKCFLQQAGENVAHGCRDKEAVNEHLECSLVDAEFGSIGGQKTDWVLLSLSLLLVERRGRLGSDGCYAGKVACKNLGERRKDTRRDHPGQM